MASFNSDIELRVKVIDKAVDDLEQKIQRINKRGINPYDVTGRRKKDAAEELRLEQSLLNIDKSRLNLEKQANVAAARTLNTKMSWLKVLQQGADTQKFITQQEQQQAALSRRQRIGGAVSSGLIGGGFPLLFGQGPVAAAGGALGGIAGGILGGQFGFALSILGTALADAIQKSEEFNKSVNALNGSLNGASSALRITTGDVEALARQLSISNDEALELLSTFTAFDDPGTIKELARSFADVGGAGTVETIASIRDEKSAVEAIDKLRGQIGNKLADQLLKQVELEGSQAASAALLDAVLAKQEKITDETQRTVTLWDRILSAFALSSGAPGVDPNKLTPEAIAGERADAIPEANRGVIDTAITNLERFYQERDRLIKKYTPEREKSNKAEIAAAERQARVIRQLEAEFAVSTKLLEIDRKIATAKVDGNEASLRELEVDRLVAESAGKVQEIKARGLNVAEEKLRIQLEENRLEKALLELDTKRALERKKLQESFETTVEGLKIELASAKALTRQELTRLKIEKERLALKDKGFSSDQVNEILALQKALEDAQAPLQSYITQTQRWLNDTESMVVSLAQSISSGISSAMSSAITGVVDGSKTVQEALSEMFGAIGRAFVNMAAEIIAQQLMMITLQMILKALGANTGGGSAPSADPVAQFNASAAQYMAEGGYVTGPTSAIIGEGGEPEYVIPASKMDTAMSRYSAGQRGESLLAGTGSESSDSYTYSPSISATTFGGQDYVTVEQMNEAVREGMAVATKRGTQGGYAKTLGALRNSRSTRARVGIG